MTALTRKLFVAAALLTGLLQVPFAWADTPQPPSADPTTLVRDELTGMTFVPVPAGCFMMGTTDGPVDERPVHEVCVSAFAIGRYEVTQREWRQVMGDNPSFFSRCGDACPVEQVSSMDALAFIRRLNSRAVGVTYRLPTEAEWEYACRSGGKAERYCGGDDLDPLAWHDRTSGGQTHPVGGRRPNGLGIYDMSGNVWEWVMDLKGRYLATGRQNPTGPAVGATRVRRGGSWLYGAPQARAAWRSSGYLDDRAMDIGFRLVRELPPGGLTPPVP